VPEGAAAAESRVVAEHGRAGDAVGGHSRAERNAPGDENVLKVLRSLPPWTYANDNEAIRRPG
jgi:hypothetical protein